MELESAGWEYASEMILKASRLKLAMAEVPVRFYKDREGRDSHLVRGGWTTPWKAGWQSLRVMFVYAPDFFLLWPGALLLLTGLSVAVSLAPGPYEFLGIGFDLHWMLLGLVSASVGYSALQLALLARVYYDFDPVSTGRLRRTLSYNRGVWLAAAMIVGGLIPNALLLVNWLDDGFRLSAIDHPSVFGLVLIVLGAQTFAFTLLLHMMSHRRRSDHT
jgi:hypothetical protein